MPRSASRGGGGEGHPPPASRTSGLGGAKGHLVFLTKCYCRMFCCFFYTSPNCSVELWADARPLEDEAAAPDPQGTQVQINARSKLPGPGGHSAEGRGASPGGAQRLEQRTEHRRMGLGGGTNGVAASWRPLGSRPAASGQLEVVGSNT